ncbi:MAG: tRNA (N(6)-L-threonylcarbamoyladenosine(37)-C(2))-methylthiotransferase MtaB [Clostridia bacterium]|nr:tRNA (N(6)-L-threonylcarbamoyladenosine(37)-C(2))-methylthiotransferase MtaB [Clostridia bacterium]
MKAALYTLGCKVNQYESQVMAETLASHGYTIVEPTQTADVYIVNSCTVTSESDRKTRQIVRRLKRQNPDAALVLTGCMPQAYPQESAALREADIVLGNRSNDRLIAALDEYFRDRQRLLLTEAHRKDDAFAPCMIHSFYGRTRAEIKIEDGCNRFCTYCAIPYARGRVRSKPLADIRAEAAALGEAGYAEIVLVGINLSAYADGAYDLADAAAAAADSEKVRRVRLGSLEPDHMTDAMLQKLARCEKLCPQFHISLQSGCDRTLRHMNRHYSADEYRALCRKLRALFADCTLSTDIMVGFPGETPEDHAASLAFAREIGFEKAHIFPYSPRAGTRAADMPQQVPKAVKEERAAEMAQAMDEVRAQYLRSLIGRTVEVLVEEDKTGHTANYTSVRIEGDCPDAGFVRVRITGADADRCVGCVSV